MDTALSPSSVKTEPQPMPQQPLPRPGDVCPQCGEGILDYNGVLLLACEKCGYTLGDGGGCT